MDARSNTSTALLDVNVPVALAVAPDVAACSTARPRVPGEPRVPRPRPPQTRNFYDYLVVAYDL